MIQGVARMGDTNLAWLLPIHSTSRELLWYQFNKLGCGCNQSPELLAELIIQDGLHFCASCYKIIFDSVLHDFCV